MHVSLTNVARVQVDTDFFSRRLALCQLSPAIHIQAQIRHSGFINTLPADEEIEFMRKDIAGSTRVLLEERKQLWAIGDRIAVHSLWY